MAELAELAGQDLTELDLHRPYVDDVTFPCPADGCAATAAPPAAGARRLVRLRLDAVRAAPPPLRGRRPVRTTAFPADFICEAIDQTRGWFYSLLAVNTLVFDSTPYRNVVCLGHIVDEDGQKMSKSKGNVIDPWAIFDTFGADALRWYFFSAGQPWAPRRVSEDGIRETTRQTPRSRSGTCFSFFATYADLDGWAPRPAATAAPTHVLDRWVLGELDDTVAAVTAALEDFDALAAATRLAQFIDDLSNWYVRRSRPRFWKSSDPAAHATLHECLVTTAPAAGAVLPVPGRRAATRTLTGERVGPPRRLARAAGPADADRVGRHGGRPPARGPRPSRPHRRQDEDAPAAAPSAAAAPGGRRSTTSAGRDRRRSSTSKPLEDVDTLSGLMSLDGRAQLPGPRARGSGPRVNEVKQALAEADGSELQPAAREPRATIEVAGERLTADEVEVRAERHEAFALAEDQGWAVALDLELDDEPAGRGRRPRAACGPSTTSARQRASTSPTASRVTHRRPTDRVPGGRRRPPRTGSPARCWPPTLTSTPPPATPSTSTVSPAVTLTRP